MLQATVLLTDRSDCSCRWQNRTSKHKPLAEDSATGSGKLMRFTKPLRLATGVVAVAASAVLVLMYMANGIAYGSLVGLKGREHDMQSLASRGIAAIIVAVICQMLAWIMLVSGLHQADGTNPWSRLKPWAVAVSVSLISTLVLMAFVLACKPHVKGRLVSEC